MKKLLKDFKEFAVGGNLIEIAVGLVLALAFGAMVTSFVENLIMPIVAALFGEPNFDGLWAVPIGDATLNFGTFVTALVTFLSTAAALYFFVVKPYQAYKARTEEPAVEEEAGPSEVELLTQIRDALARS